MRWIATLFLLLSVNTVWGWGSQGHMIVAQIAENNLTPAALKAVRQILKNQKLAEVANWADSIRNDPQWAQSKPWHFADIPDGEDYSTAEHSHNGDVIQALTTMVATLKSPKAPAAEKEVALKFIVHFMGDIHQPLHVGRPEDHGGNSIRITYEGKNTNLHSLWDSGMINESPMTYEEYAASLENGFLPAPYDLPELPFSRIIKEDMDARKEIYKFKGTVISRAYYTKNLSLLNAQLLMGGKRLAELLNQIY